MYNPLNYSGFHLIEILVTLALIGITTHWMIGHYETTLAIARRHTAERCLVAASAAMEAYALDHHTYQGARLTDLRLSKVSRDSHYRFNIQQSTRYSFRLTATPVNMQAKIDKPCGILSITAEGIKNASGQAGADKCW